MDLNSLENKQCFFTCCQKALLLQISRGFVNVIRHSFVSGFDAIKSRNTVGAWLFLLRESFLDIKACSGTYACSPEILKHVFAHCSINSYALCEEISSQQPLSNKRDGGGYSDLLIAWRQDANADNIWGVRRRNNEFKVINGHGHHTGVTCGHYISV